MIGCTAVTGSHTMQISHDMQNLQAVLQRLLSMLRTLLFNENI